jgi:hypothetical protein
MHFLLTLELNALFNKGAAEGRGILFNNRAYAVQNFQFILIKNYLILMTLFPGAADRIT